MKLSVVVPTYNRKAMVIRAVESVLSQSAPVEELIVVDDGSADGTKEALAPYGDRIRYIWQENAGVSAARNRGIEASRGEAVALLDSDDAWLPEMSRVATAALDRFPKAVAFAGNGTIRTRESEHDIFSVRGGIGEAGGFAAEGTLVKAIRAALLQPVTSGIVIRREALTAVGAFDVQCREYEDFDLWCRLSTRGDWVFSGQVLWIHYREVIDESNVSAQCWKKPRDAYFSLFRSHHRLLGNHDRTWAESRELRKTLGHYRCIVGALGMDEGLPGSRRQVLRSILDWPSLRRIGRAGAVCAGWRPAEIRGYSQDLRRGQKAPG